jgi:tetratricopeptide (TPR) repeat protein
MSENATTSTSRAMDCARVAREETAERYVAGGLSDEDRDAFEEHYFECARCFDELQAVRAIQAELQRSSTRHEPRTGRSFIRWDPAAAGLAAALVLAVGMVMWMRLPQPSRAPELTATEPPSRGQTADTPPPPQQPDGAVTPGPSLELLARVDPPRYEPPTLRDVPDEATARFLRGMERYRKAEYAAAVEDLRRAAESDPDAAHIRFFLGVTHLMLGHDADAIDRLQATIALGDSAYLEEAHWYLAKAFLRRKDLGAAEAELKKLIQLRGSASDAAGRLLAQIEQLKDRLGQTPSMR